MLFSGCAGKQSISLQEKPCPNCGEPIEIFSIDAEMACDNCGFVIYNDQLSCAQWCSYAESCFGTETYNHLMEVAESQRKRREEAQSE